MTTAPRPRPAAGVHGGGGTRRSELDGLRILVVVGLVFFHSALVFDANDDYYVKNAETTEATTYLAALAVVWAMPMLFLTAGLGSWFSMRRRGTGGFTAERLQRLGIPLVFATLTIIPIPPWLRLRAADPAYDESYLAFLPRFFDVHLDLADFPFLLGGQYFETGHLWFVVLLLAFSLLLALAAARPPPERPDRVRQWLAHAVRRRGVILLPAIPLAVVSALLGLEEAFAGWSRWAYLLFFLYGFVLASDARFRTAMRRDAGLAAAVGLTAFLVGLPAFVIADEGGADPFTDLTPLAVFARTLYGAAGWCWVVAILGLLDRPRKAAADREDAGGAGADGDASAGWGRRLQAYLAPAVLPLYVLHQPIVVAVAYGVVGWNASIPVKYAAVACGSLVLTVAAYDVLVRRTRPTRFLFGMR